MNLDDDELSEDQSHISRINTHWSIVMQAGKSRSDLAGALARAELVSRYSGAVFRYLKRILKNADDAEDIAQDIAVKILNGALAAADPGKGRFRDYVKTIVINAARTHESKRAKQNAKVRTIDDQTYAELVDKGAAEVKWEDCIREDLIAQAMIALLDHETQSGQPYSSLLHWRIANPFSDSTEMARFIERNTGKTIAAPNARKLLQRAREKLAELLLDNVRKTLPLSAQSPELLQEHLIALGVFEICQSALRPVL
jgi:DNA-directed RNA polymerase specialized sigma24 family protein